VRGHAAGPAKAAPVPGTRFLSPIKKMPLQAPQIDAGACATHAVASGPFPDTDSEPGAAIFWGKGNGISCVPALVSGFSLPEKSDLGMNL